MNYKRAIDDDLIDIIHIVSRLRNTLEELCSVLDRAVLRDTEAKKEKA